MGGGDSAVSDQVKVSTIMAQESVMRRQDTDDTMKRAPWYSSGFAFHASHRVR